MCVWSMCVRGVAYTGCILTKSRLQSELVGGHWYVAHEWTHGRSEWRHFASRSFHASLVQRSTHVCIAITEAWLGNRCVVDCYVGARSAVGPTETIRLCGKGVTKPGQLYLFLAVVGQRRHEATMTLINSVVNNRLALPATCFTRGSS